MNSLNFTLLYSTFRKGCVNNGLSIVEPLEKHNNGDLEWRSEKGKLLLTEMGQHISYVFFNKIENKLEISYPKNLTLLQILAKYEEFINL